MRRRERNAHGATQAPALDAAPWGASWRIGLSTQKIVVTAVVILLTALVGYCLAGYLTLLFLGTDTGLFKWNTYYQYVGRWISRRLRRT